MTKEKALRYNKGKREWSLVDYKSLEPLVDVLKFGADKYARDNWKLDMPIQSIVDSMIRHVTAFSDGEVNDPESGLPHIGHIMCNAMFIQYHMNKGQRWPVELKATINKADVLPEYDMSLLKAGDCVILEKEYKEVNSLGEITTFIPSGIEFKVQSDTKNRLYITRPHPCTKELALIHYIDDLKFAAIRITRCNGKD